MDKEWIYPYIYYLVNTWWSFSISLKGWVVRSPWGLKMDMLPPWGLKYYITPLIPHLAHKEFNNVLKFWGELTFLFVLLSKDKREKEKGEVG